MDIIENMKNENKKRKESRISTKTGMRRGPRRKRSAAVGKAL